MRGFGRHFFGLNINKVGSKLRYAPSPKKEEGRKVVSP